MSAEVIELRGVRVHNLKNVDLDIPRGKLVAICGVSGSGKTSLALDTLYAEGQRRYIESFSAYTRQYLDRLEKPDYDSIEGLTPALAVTRTGQARGNRSTVGTASEALDYLRLVFSAVANLRCNQCNEPVVAHSAQSVANWLSTWEPSTKVILAFEARWNDVGERATVLVDLQQQGFGRLVVANQMLRLDSDRRDQLVDLLPSSTGDADRVWVVADRLKGGSDASRVLESLENAFEQGQGQIGLFFTGDASAVPFDNVSGNGSTVHAKPSSIDDQQFHLIELSDQRRCLNCAIDYPPPEPRLFSFNSPVGACPVCEGFGDTSDWDPALIVPDDSLTILDGAIAPWNSPSYAHHLDELVDIADELRVPLDKPFRRLSAAQQKRIFEGHERAGFQGIYGFFSRLERKKYKMHIRVFLSRWRSYNRCYACDGQRLSPEALAYRLGNHSVAQLCNMTIADLLANLNLLELDERERQISRIPLEQLNARLGYLQNVGLSYLQLARPLRTLSGGEAQRTALAAALGSALVNVLYVLDEPSVGLHPHDVQQLADAIVRLKNRGNTVVVVEHEEMLLEQADHIIEVGPLAGKLGGQIVFQGDSKQLKDSDCLSGDYLSGRQSVPTRTPRRRYSDRRLRLQGCTGHNLQQLDVEFPLEMLCLVTGVSGSGKSSLVQDTLYGAIKRSIGQSAPECLDYDTLNGAEGLENCILVDQSPVSRSPRSNPITFVKAFDEIRQAFAATVDAKIRNLSASHFSFNSDLGRCQQCQGDGVLQIDMQFLADVNMVCPACNGTRYRDEILQIRYRDRNISDVLGLSVSEAISFFRGIPKLQKKLQVLVDVGLDYLGLGQPSTTLSSGEAQRLKLAGFLAAATSKETVFILDEPTTGLHYHDITKLLSCFDALLNDGHSLIVVEHNLHLIAAADHVIDLGPGPGEAGGKVVAQGRPEEIANISDSATGKYLKSHFLKLEQ